MRRLTWRAQRKLIRFVVPLLFKPPTDNTLRDFGCEGWVNKTFVVCIGAQKQTQATTVFNKTLQQLPPIVSDRLRVHHKDCIVPLKIIHLIKLGLRHHLALKPIGPLGDTPTGRK